MIKIHPRHHWGLILLLASAWLLIAAISTDKVHGEALTPVTPASVIIDQAHVIDQGVEINWIKAEAGEHPIAHYIVERSRNNSNYAEITTTEADSLSYLDSDGTAGDNYRVIAQDNQEPPARSDPSDSITANVSAPGEIAHDHPGAETTPQARAEVTTVPSTTELPSLPAPIASSPQASVPLATETSRIADSFDHAALSSTTAGTTLLHSLAGSNQQLLASLSSLSLLQQSTASDTCTRQLSFLESDFHLLPDDSEMDGLIAIAACHAVQDLTP